MNKRTFLVTLFLLGLLLFLCFVAELLPFEDTVISMLLLMATVQIEMDFIEKDVCIPKWRTYAR